MPTLRSRKSQTQRLSRMINRALDDVCDLLLDQEDGDGGVETVEDETDIDCVTYPATERVQEQADKKAPSGERRFLFDGDAPVKWKHTIRWTDDRGVTNRYRITRLEGMEPNAPFMTAEAERIDQSTP